MNGQPAKIAVLKSDAETKGKPDMVGIGDLTFFVIERGDRFGIRLKDKNSEMRRNFQGLEWYPVKAEWRIDAKWVALPAAEADRDGFDDRRQGEGGRSGLRILHRRGARSTVSSRRRRSDELFFVFRDKTAGKTTYPASRFLYAKPEGDQVVLDFNKAYNPPCAFTPYATCPLPTPGNRLPIEIPAGELKYKGGTH